MESTGNDSSGDGAPVKESEYEDRDEENTDKEAR